MPRAGFTALLKTAKEPVKNIGSNHILILGEENFLIIKSKVNLIRSNNSYE